MPWTRFPLFQRNASTILRKQLAKKVVTLMSHKLFPTLRSTCFKTFVFLSMNGVVALSNLRPSEASLAGQRSYVHVTLSRQVHTTKKEVFIPHHGDGPFESYLTMTIPYTPIQSLFTELEALLGRRLKNRGEAHLTVITPPEYNSILKSHLSMAEIEEIALKMQIQNLPFKVVCLGRAEARVDGRLEETFYVVVKSPALLRLRRAIGRAFVAAGGAVDRFNPLVYYPHITVGFSRMDIHEDQGAKKDARSCVLNISMKND